MFCPPLNKKILVVKSYSSFIVRMCFFVTGLLNSFSIHSIYSQSVRSCIVLAMPANIIIYVLSPQNTMVQARFTITSHLCLGMGFNKVQLRMELPWS